MLHYSYNKFEDLKSRRDRCDCAPTDEDAKRCFILPFDRMVSRIWPQSALHSKQCCVPLRSCQVCMARLIVSQTSCMFLEKEGHFALIGKF